MQVKLVNPSDSQVHGFLLWTFATFFLMTLASSSDPCPPESQLRPCQCTDFPLYGRTTESLTTTTTTSTPQPTSTPQITSTTEITRTYEPTSTSLSGWSTTESVRKRRHAKRQIDTFSAFSRAAHYTVFSCNFTSTAHELEDGTKGLERKWVDKVAISNHRPGNGSLQVRLPNRLFSNMRMKQFEITQTPLAGDFINSGDPFDGQENSLMWFTVNYCFLRGQLTYSDKGTVHTMGLNKLKNLLGLDFSHNELEVVRDSAFRYSGVNLITVRLSYNKISGMDTWVFQKLSKLRSLDLSHNLLETVRKTMFPPNAKRLFYIDLSWNRLTTLPIDFFSTMPALRIFNVSNNYIYTMPSNPWASVWRQLQFLDITGNYLSCDCSLMWIPPILSGSEGNGTTVSPPLQGQIILGSCSAFQPDSYPEHYPLANLTQSSLDC